MEVMGRLKIITSRPALVGFQTGSYRTGNGTAFTQDSYHQPTFQSLRTNNF
jgi:hypothetical protein